MQQLLVRGGGGGERTTTTTTMTSRFVSSSGGGGGAGGGNKNIIGNKRRRRRRINASSVVICCGAIIMLLLVLLGLLYFQLNILYLTTAHHHQQREGEGGGGGGQAKNMIKNKKTQQQRQQQQQKQPKDRPFPRWGVDNEDNGGIPLNPIVQFSRGVLYKNASIFPSGLGGGYPELPYIVDSHGIWVSSNIRSRIKKGKSKVGRIKERVHPTEQIMLQAWKRLMLQQTNTTSASHQPSKKWPNLVRAVAGSSDAGFPFLFFYGDAAGDKISCNYHNWVRKRASSTGKSQYESIPIFTTCAKVNCQYAFPFPTYQTITDSKRSSEEWHATQADYKKQYPWSSKMRKLVWRGSLTGPLQNYTSTRARIGIFAATNKNNPLFDIGLTRIPSARKEEIDIQRLGGITSSIPMMDFQKYAAILDIDGNSWSSRFGNLLCYNSVVLKIEPRYVDYFHFRHNLLPWKHYVPVKYDLSNLIEQTAWVMDAANEKQVLQIIKSANEWCSSHMTHTSIVNDVLDIWDAYVRYLDKNDPQWMQQWSQEKQKDLFENELGMTNISTT